MSLKTKVLFFINGPVATPEEIAKADSLMSVNQLVCFRNALHVGPVDSVESCNAVAGCVPERYAHLPRVGDEQAELPLQPALPPVASPAPVVASPAPVIEEAVSPPVAAPVAKPAQKPGKKK